MLVDADETDRRASGISRLRVFAVVGRRSLPSLVEATVFPAVLYMAALDEADMPTDRAFRDAVREHVEFGTRVAMQNSHAETEEELHPLREVPRWTWAGDQPAG